MKRKWVKVVCMTLMLALLGAGAAWGATKNGDTGRYAFQDYETLKPGLFVLDPVMRRYVDSGYKAYWAGLKAQEPIVAKAARCSLKKVHMYRTLMLYSGVATIPGYMVEVGNARSVAWVAADNWALAHGKPAPYGCAAYSEFLSIPYSVRNMPGGPALTLVTGAFTGFNRRLDPLTGMGLNSSLLVNAAMCGFKAATFYLFLDTGSGVEILARPWIHNYMVWDALTDIPANWIVDAAYSFKGVPYGQLFEYQNSNTPVGATGKFGKQYKAMSKFGQLVF